MLRNNTNRLSQHNQLNYPLTDPNDPSLLTPGFVYRVYPGVTANYPSHPNTNRLGT